MIKQPILKRSIDRSIVVIVEIARIFYAKSIVTVFIILLCRPIFEDTNTTVAIIELDCALCLFDCSKNCWMQFLKNHQSKQIKKKSNFIRGTDVIFKNLQSQHSLKKVMERSRRKLFLTTQQISLYNSSDNHQ